MLIGRVVGTVASTRKHRLFEGFKLLQVQPLTVEGEEIGDPILVVDTQQAGVGDRVLVAMDGGTAQMVAGRPGIPLDMITVGIVDFVDLLERPGEKP